MTTHEPELLSSVHLHRVQGLKWPFIKMTLLILDAESLRQISDREKIVSGCIEGGVQRGVYRGNL